MSREEAWQLIIKQYLNGIRYSEKEQGPKMFAPVPETGLIAAAIDIIVDLKGN